MKKLYVGENDINLINNPLHIDDLRVYEVLYTPFTHEGGMITISVHKTKEGAEKALKNHKKKIKSKHNKLYQNMSPPFKWDWAKWWEINEIKILE